MDEECTRPGRCLELVVCVCFKALVLLSDRIGVTGRKNLCHLLPAVLLWDKCRNKI